MHQFINRAFFALWFCATCGAPAAFANESGNAIHQPAWKRHFVAWSRFQENESVWRNDPRLADQFHQDFPDDLAVLFRKTGPKDGISETMWVSVIDYDSESDRYLGILLNQPSHLKSVRKGDNVVFAWNQETGFPQAIAEDQSYWAAGVPTDAKSGILGKLYEGIRQFRFGNYGHNMPEIKKCLKTLSRVSRKLGKKGDSENSYITHVFLGRCAAEAYETELAIDHFRKAVGYKPDDVNAQMALLAEYSVMVHTSKAKDTKQTQTDWEALFLKQLELVKSRFHNNESVKKIIQIVFDGEQLERYPELSKEEIEYGKKYGFGIFRWKIP